MSMDHPYLPDKMSAPPVQSKTGLLPTIQSRCVRLDLKVVDDGLVKKYLMEHLHVPDYQAEIDASLSLIHI